MTKLRELWERVSSGLWFVPTLLVIGHALLAIGLIVLDRHLDLGADGDEVTWIFRGGADSARAMLSTVATTMMTVMGVVFSVTIVALQLASSQYTPRVLYTFIRDRGNQIVMGSFIGTFTYAMIVLRAVRSPEDGEVFVPTVSVTGGIVLALVSVGALIYFIHHISTGIRVSHIIARIAHSTQPLMTRPFPRKAGQAIHMEPRPARSADARPVVARGSGYVQMVDGNALIAAASRHGGVIHMQAGPGDFVTAGMPLLWLDPPGDRDPDRDDDLHDAVALGTERSMLQDPEFGVRQLMDISVKALSPSINDPTTAITCLDYLGMLMVEIAGEEDPSSLRADEEGRLRLVARGATFDSLLAHGFDQIRQHMAGEVGVTMRFLTVLARIGTHLQDPERRQMLWTQAREAMRDADDAIGAVRDREAVNGTLRELADAIHYDPAPLLLSLPH